MSDRPIGTCCFVLHSHLPWVLRHGSWPVGEEWLYQAWARSYLPLVELLYRMAESGHRELLTLGLTPVLAAQLDDPYALGSFHTWLGDWRTRAENLAGTGTRQAALGRREVGLANRALAEFEGRWMSGGSAALRPLVDGGAIEILGGPATHPFLPLLDERLARFSLQTGLDDGAKRIGHRPRGVWAPECGYRPGLEEAFAAGGAGHLVLDGPTLLAAGASTSQAWTLGDTDVVAFGRDLDVSYRVWSPRRGYPGGRWYRDFHTSDERYGLQLSRVTSTRTPPSAKAPYDPTLARAAVSRDVSDFVSTVRARLEDHHRALGRPGVVVVAYDTELFGHWWHEGPQFLEEVLRELPSAGVRLNTLSGAIADGHVAGRIDPREGSWGSRKDFHVWDGPAVADVANEGITIQKQLLATVDRVHVTESFAPQSWSATLGRGDHRRDLDQLARAALLTLASDWPFMISHDTAADYARQRFRGHAADFEALAALIDSGAVAQAYDLADRQSHTDGPFRHLDSRHLLDRQRS